MDEDELPEEEFIEEKGMDLTEGQASSAILIGVTSGSDKKLGEEHTNELENLATTFGVPTVAKVLCPVRKIDASTYLQKGKLEEIAEAIANSHATLLIFDEEITPAQQRNLEKLLKIPVMDRTELILEIFAQRAQTKEARLQVELARTKYQFPRLKRLWSHFSRQRAKGGYLKGEGEKQIEIDKRLLKKKVEKLQGELKEVERYRQTQRQSRTRSGIPSFAIVGYTNAGKSTLLKALTDADVLVEDKLFATLDPTTRKFTLPNNQEILLTDTVGFIRKLPHTLVAAFKSTLEAAVHDDFILHLVDVSHPLAEEQAEITYHLLHELGADENSIITVLNKIDLCEDRKMIDRIRVQYPKTVLISAVKGTGFEDLMDSMIKELQKRRQVVKLKISQKDYHLITEIQRVGLIHYQEYEDNDIVIKAEIPLVLLYKFENYRIK